MRLMAKNVWNADKRITLHGYVNKDSRSSRRNPIQTGSRIRKSQCMMLVTSESDCEYVLTVQEVHSVKKKKKITALMIVNGQTVKFQLDCGSSVKILPETLYMQLCKDHEDLTETNMTLVMYNKSETKPLGKRRLNLRNPRNKKKYSIEFVIVGGTELRFLEFQLLK